MREFACSRSSFPTLTSTFIWRVSQQTNSDESRLLDFVWRRQHADQSSESDPQLDAKGVWNLVPPCKSSCKNAPKTPCKSPPGLFGGSDRYKIDHSRVAVKGKCGSSMVNIACNINNLRWSGRRDSNPRPSAPKADALPDCATPRYARLLASSCLF